MRLDRKEIRAGLQHIAAQEPDDSTSWTRRNYREIALEALAYIRQLEGDLRRAGFIEYNDPKEKETEE